MSVSKEDLCRYPGCGQQRVRVGHGGQRYCALPEHNHDTAYRARKRIAEAEAMAELQRLRQLVAQQAHVA